MNTTVFGQLVTVVEVTEVDVIVCVTNAVTVGVVVTVLVDVEAGAGEMVLSAVSQSSPKMGKVKS